jgi:hypothetical protein
MAVLVKQSGGELRRHLELNSHLYGDDYGRFRETVVSFYTATLSVGHRWWSPPHGGGCSREGQGQGLWRSWTSQCDEGRPMVRRRRRRRC